MIHGLGPSGQFGTTSTSNWDINQGTFKDLFADGPKGDDGAAKVFSDSFLSSAISLLNTNNTAVAIMPNEVDFTRGNTCKIQSQQSPAGWLIVPIRYTCI